MIGLSIEAKDELLSLFVSQAFTVGLFNGDQEIVDPRYERTRIQFGTPQAEPGDEDGSVRFVENMNEVRFDDLGRDHTVDHFGLFDMNGKLRSLFKLERARDLPAEDNAVFRPGSLKIGIP